MRRETEDLYVALDRILQYASCIGVHPVVRSCVALDACWDFDSAPWEVVEGVNMEIGFEPTRSLDLGRPVVGRDSLEASCVQTGSVSVGIVMRSHRTGLARMLEPQRAATRALRHAGHTRCAEPRAAWGEAVGARHFVGDRMARSDLGASADSAIPRGSVISMVKQHLGRSR